MTKSKIHNKLFLVNPLFLLMLCFPPHAQTNTITSRISITDPDSLVSPGRKFVLGFFTPENTTNRYLAIYYVVSETTVVWVANRETPLTDSSGTVTVSDDGNLVLTDRRNETVWSTNATTAPTNTTAELLDTGNLVLRENSNGIVIWDSFSHPTNCLLPCPKMDDLRTRITSWRSPSDPGIGNFTAGVEGPNSPQIITWENGRRYYRTGLWSGTIFLGVPDMYSKPPPMNLIQVKNNSGNFYVAAPPENSLFKFELNSTGGLAQTISNQHNRSWDILWVGPKNECDLYDKCGPNGLCNPLDSPICSCLRGFLPANRVEWGSRNWSSGCVRQKELKCGQENEDGFLRMPNVKVPDFAEQAQGGSEDECRTMCLRNCSCLAYSYDIDIRCMLWGERLVDVQQFNGIGAVMYLRLAASELDNNNGKRLVMIIVPIVLGVLFLSLCIFIAWWCVAMGKGKKIQDQKKPETSSIILQDESEGDHFQVLPIFTFKTLADATNQFHDDNMLGRGGFGCVYKGKLANGEDIAVKRLSINSGQGGEEFRNEAIVISKVQHRNLVKLLGCCVEREEKMLVYEYMPNISLDLCLFDPTHPSQKILDWKKRFSIAEGIGRGLLYLHRDSRQKIIHRDLKPSNVLLDEDWNPKISDFGMARIFGSNQDQANTTRVVGTYGYMAPEYAMEGQFSEKSDVYSFGILLLEIVSGKKNTRYYNQEWSLSLLGCAWKLWNEENGIAVVDEAIMSLNDETEIVRCIHIALLCVQECPRDRPAFEAVMSMLNREIVDLPLPEQPHFEEMWDCSRAGLNQRTSQCKFSINKLSATMLHGR